MVDKSLVQCAGRHYGQHHAGWIFRADVNSGDSAFGLCLSWIIQHGLCLVTGADGYSKFIAAADDSAGGKDLDL